MSRLRQHIIELRNAKKDKEYKKDEQEFNGISVDLKKLTDLNELSGCFENSNIEEIKNALQALINKEAIDVSPGDYDNAIRIKLKRILGSDLSKRAVDVKIGTISDINTVLNNITSKDSCSSNFIYGVFKYKFIILKKKIISL